MRRIGFVVVLALVVSTPASATGWDTKGTWWAELAAWWATYFSSATGAESVLVPEDPLVGSGENSPPSGPDTLTTEGDYSTGMDPNGR